MTLVLCWMFGHDWRDPFSWWPAHPGDMRYIGDVRCIRCSAHVCDWRGWV